MSKFVLYRTAVDDQWIEEEVVAVEYGASFEDVLEDLLQAIRDDLSGAPEYDNCEVNAYGPDDEYGISSDGYEMTGVVLPPNASENVVVDYVAREVEA
mgnify:CR=1 FL=1